MCVCVCVCVPSACTQFCWVNNKKAEKKTKQEDNEVSNERTSKSHGNWSPSDVQNWRKKNVLCECVCVHVTGHCRTEDYTDFTLVSIRNLRPGGLTKTWHEKVTKLKKQFAAGHNTSSVQERVSCECVCVCVLFSLADNTTRVQYEQLNTVTKSCQADKTGRVVVVLSRSEHINSAQQSTLNSHFNGLPHCC